MVTLKVLAKHTRSVELGWSLTPKVTGYTVERAEPGLSWTLLGTVPGPLFTDPTCKPNTMYGYRVTTIGLTPEESAIDQATTLPKTEFASPAEFCEKFLAPTFARDPRQRDQFAWCPEWFKHQEAAFVIESLWRSYEKHRPPDDPLEPSSDHAYWLVQIAYPLLQQLWFADATFRGCTDAHQDPPRVKPLGTLAPN